MKRAWLLVFLLFPAVACPPWRGFAQKVNPHTQIGWPAVCSTPGMVYDSAANTCIDMMHIPPANVAWPAACNAPGMVYNIATNTCTNIQAIPPTNVTWPASCATGVYVPATNTCVPTGTAANPAPATSTLQMNAGGVFGPVNSSFVDSLGNVQLLAMATSLNTILYVKAPPFNAKCDGTTDDQAAIQAALDAALAQGTQVQFPKGTCLTSMIVWKGTPFFGSGIATTIIKGKPGQDVFQTPDGNTWTIPTGGTLVHDLKILVDTTVDASATAAGGNNSFPNRISGTNGGASNPITPAISPGPAPFGIYNGIDVGCAGTISAGSLNTITFSGTGAGNFCVNSLLGLDSKRIVGAPITINGVGAGGTALVTTITAVTGAKTLTFTTPATTPGTNLSGTFLAPLTPPWYIGNCGFAFPNSNGATPSPNLNGWMFQNVMILATGGPFQGNHSCGIFMQAPPYATKFQNVQVQGFYGGYVEAFPALNPASSTWAGDTSNYKNFDLQFNLIPMVIIGGGHRIFEGINIYGGVQYQTLGAMFINGGGSATITRYYNECGLSTGELARFSSGYGINITGGALDQCLPIHYVGWNASQSTVDAQVNNMHIFSGANLNTFKHSQLNPIYLVDNGLNNSVETNGTTNPTAVPRSFYANRPQEPVGKLDAGWLLSGNSTTPFTSGSDLMMTCADFNFATYLVGSSYQTSCISDPAGTEITDSYFQALQYTGGVSVVSGTGGTGMTPGTYPLAFSGGGGTGAAGTITVLTATSFNPPVLSAFGTGYTSAPTVTAATGGTPPTLTASIVYWVGGWNLGPTNQGTGPFGKLLIVGDRLPQARMNFVAIGRCPSGACTQLFTFRDVTQTNIGITSATLSFGTNWTVQTAPIDFSVSPVVAGDQISITAAAPVPWISGSEMDTAVWAFQPTNADTITQVFAGNSVARAATAMGSPVVIGARNITFNAGSLAVDSTAPGGYAWVLPQTGGASATIFGVGTWNGGLPSTFPTSYGLLQWSMNAPSIWTDTLNGALTNVATSCTITGSPSGSMVANGYFLIDSEILGYGTIPGSSTFTCTRGNFGTIAASHSNGAAVSSAAVAQLITKCGPGGPDVSAGRVLVPILPSWQQYRQAFDGPGCSGLTPGFNVAATTGSPTGQTFKVGSITISSLQGVLPQPTAANQVVTSGAALTGGSWYAFNSLTTMPPVRAGAWSVSASVSAPVTFSPVMLATPTSCAVTPSASPSTTGSPYATSLSTTGFTVNLPTSGTLAGTYLCAITNTY